MPDTQGQCLCGDLRFEADFPSQWVAHCHCTLCQRAHGAGVVTWVGFEAGQVRIDDPQAIEHTYARQSRAPFNVTGSPALSVPVGFSKSGLPLAMQIRDDGRGGVQAEGNGLCGMRERVLALGGQLAVQSARGEGTVLTVRVPLAAATSPLPPAAPPVQGGAA